MIEVEADAKKHDHPASPPDAGLKAVILAERCRRKKDSVFGEKIKEWEAYDGKNYR